MDTRSREGTIEFRRNYLIVQSKYCKRGETNLTRNGMLDPAGAFDNVKISRMDRLIRENTVNNLILGCGSGHRFY